MNLIRALICLGAMAAGLVAVVLGVHTGRPALALAGVVALILLMMAPGPGGK